MKAKHLILTLTLTLAAGAAAAAIGYGRVEPMPAVTALSAPAAPIARIVVSAQLTPVAEAPIARIVIVGHRADDGRAVVPSN